MYKFERNSTATVLPLGIDGTTAGGPNCINFEQIVLGYVLVEFFTNSSGHPALRVSEYTASVMDLPHCLLTVIGFGQALNSLKWYRGIMSPD
jgi:hypothetical protein